MEKSKIKKRTILAAITIAIAAIVIMATLMIATQTPEVHASLPEWRGKQWEPKRGWVNLYNFTVLATANPLMPVWVTVETNGRIIDFTPLNLPFDKLGNETITIGPIWPSGRHEILIVVDIPADVDLHYNITVRTPFLSVMVGI